jgi:pimeloyl-ACP methyl ester carboxylesterase
MPEGRVLQALFVHGMGRSPLSGWPLLRRLKGAGLETQTFGYAVTIHGFSAIAERLSARIEQLARQGDYILIGHSLGGVLIRAALADLHADVPRPRHLFLLGSPVQPARLARRLRFNPIFRALTRDCGQLLGSGRRMRGIKVPNVPVTAVTGTRAAPRALGLFGNEPNDGIVSASETFADWIEDRVEIPVVHTLLPSSLEAADAILRRLKLRMPSWAGNSTDS